MSELVNPNEKIAAFRDALQIVAKECAVFLAAVEANEEWYRALKEYEPTNKQIELERDALRAAAVALGLDKQISAKVAEMTQETNDKTSAPKRGRKRRCI